MISVTLLYFEHQFGRVLIHVNLCDMILNPVSAPVSLKRSKRLGTVFLCCNIVLLNFILNDNLSFSYIVGRMGKLEDIDVRIFCAAAMDFYRTQVRQVIAASSVSCKLCLRADWSLKPRKLLTRDHSFSISMDDFICLQSPFSLFMMFFWGGGIE